MSEYCFLTILKQKFVTNLNRVVYIAARISELISNHSCPRPPSLIMPNHTHAQMNHEITLSIPWGPIRPWGNECVPVSLYRCSGALFKRWYMPTGARAPSSRPASRQAAAAKLSFSAKLGNCGPKL